MAQKDAEQLELDGTGVESLPLFSGTPVQVTLPAAGEVEVVSPDQASFAACRVCMDTGLVGDKYCSCAAGVALRLARRQQ